MKRIVAREILDEIEPRDPQALAARHDLRVINRLMRNARWISQLAEQQLDLTQPLRVLDLGSGDATFLLSVVQRFPPGNGRSHAWAVDRRSLVTPEIVDRFRDRGWDLQVAEADAVEWLRHNHPLEQSLVIANLFLHHLPDESLRELLQGVSWAKLFVACEPRRSYFALTASRLLWAVGSNAITRHDAVVSVRAGFRAQEISALWPDGVGWRLEERPMGLFSHCFSAQMTRSD